MSSILSGGWGWITNFFCATLCTLSNLLVIHLTAQKFIQVRKMLGCSNKNMRIAILSTDTFIAFTCFSDLM